MTGIQASSASFADTGILFEVVVAECHPQHILVTLNIRRSYNIEWDVVQRNLCCLIQMTTTHQMILVRTLVQGCGHFTQTGLQGMLVLK